MPSKRWTCQCHLGVALAHGETIKSAVATAREVAVLVDITISND